MWVVRVFVSVHYLGDAKIEAGRGTLLRLTEVDLGEERLADPERLARRDILESLIPAFGMDVRVVPERPPETRRAERKERSHDDGQRPAHAQRDMECGPAGRAVLLDEIPRRLRIEVLVSRACELDR